MPPAAARRILLPPAISQEPPPTGGVLREYSGETMGTTWSVRVVEGWPADHGTDAAALQAELDAVVAQMSHWEADSDLGRFNRAPAGSWHVLPEAFFHVLSFAMDVSRESGRACDPCAGEIVNLWGFGPHGRFGQPDFVPPSPQAVQDAMRRQRSIELDAPRRRAFQPGGVQLDLSAVAKGYAVDCLARHLDGAGVANYLVEVGGELRGAGVKPDGLPWWVSLESPEQSAGEIVAALHGLAVATSGDYRRYFMHEGRRHAHTIDPRTGTPVSNGVSSVTVVHELCMAADAWSTAMTVLGARDGVALAERKGLAVHFLVREEGGLREYMSSAMRAMLEEE
ncbi:FAD:protein FMN transferase [Massilia endophytica]|uniref:FAD:protein FMN transferase n=1 Tax=Massilia endophytica TaxID=2899220 RepID=UPI001E56AE83|nr:FAD:protein FMN transferase [Massilia endophytica]UGQ45047.1 FAD:protein FMN transferase [Massilia endophytica]